jgi:hypothetical protein
VTLELPERIAVERIITLRPESWTLRGRRQRPLPSAGPAAVHGNAFLDARRGERAWFGVPRGVDLQWLPRGQQDLADITRHVIDYATAPTPDTIILGGEAARWNPVHARNLEDRGTGIRVGRKADVLNYADGQQREIPVVLEQQIGHWVQDQPAALPDARIAGRQPLPALDGRYAVLYAMQAANPRPDVPIETIDLLRIGQRVVPAVLGITLGEVLATDSRPR